MSKWSSCLIAGSQKLRLRSGVCNRVLNCVDLPGNAINRHAIPFSLCATTPDMKRDSVQRRVVFWKTKTTAVQRATSGCIPKTLTERPSTYNQTSVRYYSNTLRAPKKRKLPTNVNRLSDQRETQRGAMPHKQLAVHKRRRTYHVRSIKHSTLALRLGKQRQLHV